MSTHEEKHVEVPAPEPEKTTAAHRIVSLAPNLTETVFALGAGDTLVGVTRYCDFPAAALKIPKVGGLIQPDFEALLSRQPTLVLAVEVSQPAAGLDTLRKAGIQVETLKMDSLEDIYAAIERLGSILDREQEAARTLRELRQTIQPVEVVGSRPEVLFAIGHRPLVAVGSGSYLDELIRLAGGRNTFGDSPTAYVTTDLEVVLSKNPEVLLDGYMTRGEDVRIRWSEFGALSAVRENKVFLVDPVFLRPGPRVGQAFVALREHIGGGIRER